ncbi:MAG: hypothetical protein ACPF83_01040 [Flavobacteriales bacterium]
MSVLLRLVLLMITLLPLSGIAQAVLHVVEEELYIGEVYPELNNTRRYRFYLELESPTDRLVELYASETQPGAWGATAPILSTGIGNLFAGNTDCGDLNAYPSAYADPFLSIGTHHGCEYNASGSAAFVSPTAPSLGAAFNAFPDTVDLLDLSITLPEDHPAGLPGSNNWVLVGQSTTAGVPYLMLNARVLNSAGQLVVYEGLESATYLRGCTNPEATNYNPQAVEDDGSCTLGPLRKVWWEDITPDPGAPGYPAGHNTFRLYAQLADSTDRFSSAFALDQENDLTVTTTNGVIWNTVFGGFEADQITPAFYDIFPEVLYDSWVTVSDEDDTGSAEVTTVALFPSGSVFTESFNTTDGPPLFLQDGAWFGLGEEAGFIADPDSSVLLAQVTTEGQLRYALNIQIIDEDEAEWLYVHTFDQAYNSPDTHLSGPGYCLSNMPYEACLDPGACNYDGDGVGAQHTPALCDYDDCVGCTDPSALNYDYTALLQGNCVFPCQVEVAESGWTCAYDSDAEEVAYALNLILNYTNDGCDLTGACLLPEEGDTVCYNFDALGLTPNGSGGLFSIPSTSIPEGTYTLSLQGANSYVEGSVLEVEVFACVAGCTDVEANNFNPEATLEDGSCDYTCPQDTPNPLYISVSTAFYASYLTVELLDEDGNSLFLADDFMNNSATLDSVCVDNGCYTLLLEDALGSGSWEGAEVVLNNGVQNIHTATMTSGFWELDLIDINATCPNDGCTDPLAINYDPFATVNDGSCLYDSDNPGPESTPPEGDEITTLLATPAGGNPTLVLGGLEPNVLMRVTVLDAGAREVYNQAFTPLESSAEIPVPLTDWAAGFFVIQVVQNDRVATFNVARFAP